MIEMHHGITLLSGAMMDYNNPQDCECTIEDIAGALSNICRFSGHLPVFYSVAQHCVNVSLLLEGTGFEYVGLLHDTAEAFTNDIPTPLKAAVPAFKELEVRIEQATSQRFGFQFPFEGVVKQADLKMLKLEKEGIKFDDSEWEALRGIRLEMKDRERVELEPWSPSMAYGRFMGRFLELRGRGF